MLAPRDSSLWTNPLVTLVNAALIQSNRMARSHSALQLSRAGGRQVRRQRRRPRCHSALMVCALHHRALHDNGPTGTRWHDRGIEPLKEAERLWRESHLKPLAPSASPEVFPSVAKAGD